VLLKPLNNIKNIAENFIYNFITVSPLPLLRLHLFINFLFINFLLNNFAEAIEILIILKKLFFI